MTDVSDSERFVKRMAMGNTGTGPVGVVGPGQVGLPLAIEFAQAEYDVVGEDIDED